MRYILVIVVAYILMIASFQPINFNEYNKESISVSVSGCGIEQQELTLENYSTLQDVFELITLNQHADLSSFNPSLYVHDNDKIIIPCIQEKQKISINTATVEQLTQLDGIGESTALKIIEYRTNMGLFQSIEEIMNIPGIKEARFNKIKENICL